MAEAAVVTKKAGANGSEDSFLEGVGGQLLEACERGQELVTFKGVEILVVEPTLQVRDRWLQIMDARPTGELDKDGDPIHKAHGSLAEANVYLVITCAHDPVTKKPLFNMNSRKKLMGLPTTGFVDPVAKAASQLMKSADDESKNSEATETDSSGSESPAESDAP